MEAVSVVLDNFHGFELFQPCAFGDLVFSLVGIVFQVPHIGNVTDVPHPVAEVSEIPGDGIKSHEGANVA